MHLYQHHLLFLSNGRKHLAIPVVDLALFDNVFTFVTYTHTTFLNACCAFAFRLRLVSAAAFFYLTEVELKSQAVKSSGVFVIDYAIVR